MRSERGFTLIEVLVSALVVTLIAGAVAGGLIASTKYTAAQHSRSQAEALARKDQERLKGLSAAQLDNLNQTYTATLDKTPFTVNSKAWYLNSTSGASCTPSGGAGATYFKTITTVSAVNPTNRVVTTLASDESVIAPPAGGVILTQFEDQTLAPLSGVTVAATGPDSATASTDVNGCAIFSALQTGNYTLTYTDLGYVDRDGNASPLPDSTSVASTGQATPKKGNPVKLGLGGGITATFTTAANNSSNNAAVFNAQADGLSWWSGGGAGIPMSAYRTNAQPTTGTIPTTTASGPASSMGLFPFVSSQSPTSYSNNYQVWAGTCRQEQPPVATDMFSVTPGASQSSFVSEPALQLTVTYNAVAKVPSDVKITFQSATGTACSDTWGPLAATNAGPSSSWVYGLPFASAATTGATASSSGQTGSITVCADYNKGAGSYVHSTTAGFTDSFSGGPVPQTLALVNGSTAGKC